MYGGSGSDEPKFELVLLSIMVQCTNRTTYNIYPSDI